MWHSLNARTPFLFQWLFPDSEQAKNFVLTCHFFLSHTYPYYVKWSYATFYVLCGATTYPYLPYEIIDPLDPIGLPQGVPRFQLQYIKLNTPSYIAILILFTYMTVNGV